MLIIVISLTGLLLSYFYAKPFVKTQEQKDILLRSILILIPISIVGYGIVMYYTEYDKPESFKASIKFLQQRTDIKNKIGSYESYSYLDQDLPKKEDNPARFKLSMKGSDAIIYLSCEARKNNSGSWYIVHLSQDSLIEVNK
jgi:hypothetical protein